MNEKTNFSQSNTGCILCNNEFDWKIDATKFMATKKPIRSSIKGSSEISTEEEARLKTSTSSVGSSI